MNVLDEMKKVIEETREELNKLVLTEEYENYYAVSQKMDCLIAEYIEAQITATA